MYDDIKKDKELTWEKWLEQNWNEHFTNFNQQDCRIIEDTLVEGWNGLFNMLPILTHTIYAELVFMVEHKVEKYDLQDKIDNENEDDYTKLLDTINYMATYDCYVLKRGLDDVMLGWGDDEPFYELEDGYVKWDVGDRANATSLFPYKPLCELFDYNEYNSEGAEIPYKATVKITGNIKKLGE